MGNMAGIMELLESSRAHAGKRASKGVAQSEDFAAFVAKVSERLGLGETAGAASGDAGQLPATSAEEALAADTEGKDPPAASETQPDALPIIALFAPPGSKDAHAPVQEDSPSRSAGVETGVRSSPAGSLLSDGLGKTQGKSAKDDAAIAAESAPGAGQYLPADGLLLADRQGDGQTPGIVLADAGKGELEKPVQGPSPQAEIQAGRAFEQALRQTESKLHAAVDAPVRSSAFTDEFAAKVVWLGGRKEQVAELTLNPPDLGAVEVRLKVTGNETGAQFYSANPVVRETIEGAIPRLRELMAEAGLRLGDAQVSDQSPGREKSGDGLPGGGHAAAASAPAATSDGIVPREGRRAWGLGVVDLYV